MKEKMKTLSKEVDILRKQNLIKEREVSRAGDIVI